MAAPTAPVTSLVIFESAVGDPDTLTGFEQAINSVFARSQSETIEAVRRLYYQELWCTRCRWKYREIANLGRWLCSQHAMDPKIDSDTNVPSWPCCGKHGWATEGCVPADHTTAEDGYAFRYTRHHDLNLPPPFVASLELLFGPVRGKDRDQPYIEADNRYVIVRFDKKTHDTLQSRIAPPLSHNL